VIEEALKLTVYFGERDRVEGRFLADALVDLYERHRLTTSVMLRGVEGFGLRHTLHTDRLLTLSEDLPLISVAVDSRATIERLVSGVRALMGDGLLTLERARMAQRGIADATHGLDPDGMAKVTVYPITTSSQDCRCGRS
jgi:PII-like signaling protein